MERHEAFRERIQIRGSRRGANGVEALTNEPRRSRNRHRQAFQGSFQKRRASSAGLRVRRLRGLAQGFFSRRASAATPTTRPAISAPSTDARNAITTYLYDALNRR